eukprot:1495740-Pleurochrysis_carterae.AAC.3
MRRLTNRADRRVERGPRVDGGGGCIGSTPTRRPPGDGEQRLGLTESKSPSSPPRRQRGRAPTALCLGASPTLTERGARQSSPRLKASG